MVDLQKPMQYCMDFACFRFKLLGCAVLLLMIIVHLQPLNGTTVICGNPVRQSGSIFLSSVWEDDSGSGSSYLYGFLDQAWRPNMNKDEAEV